MVEVAPPVHSSEHAAVLAPDPVAAAAEPAPVRAGHRGDCLPRSSPQPLFVIDCAFLI